MAAITAVFKENATRATLTLGRNIFGLRRQQGIAFAEIPGGLSVKVTESLKRPAVPEANLALVLSGLSAGGLAEIVEVRRGRSDVASRLNAVTALGQIEAASTGRRTITRVTVAQPGVQIVAGPEADHTVIDVTKLG